MTERARVELYNVIGKLGGHLCAVANGWKVFRYVDGVRHQQLGDFGRDEGKARAYAEAWNGGKV